jgi:hypothetical protein
MSVCGIGILSQLQHICDMTQASSFFPIREIEGNRRPWL